MLISVCQIYFRNGESIVEFNRIHAPVSKDVCVCVCVCVCVYTHYKQFQEKKAPLSIIFHIWIEIINY